MRRYIIILMLLVFGRVSAQEAVSLLCEQRANPEGIDVVRPRLSWQFSGDQTAWQVIVASSKEKLAKDVGDLWNSGKIGNDKSVLVGYAGVPLKSRMDCYWKVKVWTNKGESGWSKPAVWSMGLLKPSDWKGKWIGYDQGFAWDSVSKFSRLSARYFRKGFEMGGAIRRAKLYIAGPGHYEVAINGKAIGGQVLAQAPTDYTKSVSYNTYDVTKECNSGANVLDVVLGNGRFFTMRPKYKPKKIKEFGFPKLLL
jgi:alpha-L-rhamnosidase